MRLQPHLHRALGLLPEDLALPRLRDLDPPAAPVRPLRDGQYTGDITITTWNAQALFASNPVRHGLKAAYVHRLMLKTDVLLVTETHGTETGNATWRPPPGCSAWWSQGPTAGHSGVGFVIKDEFLRNFEHPPRLHHIWRGRAAKLCLRGSQGALDLVVVYFPSGSRANPSESDLAGIPRRHRASLTNFPAMRGYMRQLLANNVKDRSR